MSKVYTKVSSFGVVILLIAIIFPLAVNNITNTTITKTRTTSLNDSVFVTLNGTLNYSQHENLVLKPSYTNYTNIWYNVTSDLTVDRLLYIEFTVNDSSNTIPYKCDLSLNNLTSSFPFNASYAFNESFQFNRLFNVTVPYYSAILDPPYYIETLSLKFYSINSADIDLDINIYMTEEYSDNETSFMNSIYQIIPVLAVIGIIIYFVSYIQKKKKES